MAIQTQFQAAILNSFNRDQVTRNSVRYSTEEACLDSAETASQACVGRFRCSFLGSIVIQWPRVIWASNHIRNSALQRDFAKGLAQRLGAQLYSHLLPSGTCTSRFSSPGGESLYDDSSRWYSVSKSAIVARKWASSSITGTLREEERVEQTTTQHE